jgi:EpsI family protein
MLIDKFSIKKIDYQKLVFISTISIPWIVVIILYRSFFDFTKVYSNAVSQNQYSFLLISLFICIFVYRATQLRWNPTSQWSKSGTLYLIIGLIICLIGNSQQLDLIEIFSLMPVLMGISKLMSGKRSAKELKFPVLFIFFALPYPGWVIQSITNPLKIFISYSAESILYFFDFPVARQGVVLALGQYRLLVADACSGLHSIIFLLAIGFLYINFTKKRHFLHQLIAISLIFPLAVICNLFRVLSLLLMTYYLGDEIGQSVLHEILGVIAYSVVFLLFVQFDNSLALRFPISKPTVSYKDYSNFNGQFRHTLSWRRSFWITLILCLAITLELFISPNKQISTQNESVNLEALIPKKIGEWEQSTIYDYLQITESQRQNLDQIYSQTLYRTYINKSGNKVMLSIAYGGVQFGNSLQMHRPEFCYEAQGFDVKAIDDQQLDFPRQILNVRRLLATRGSRIETITYWMTVGKLTALPGFSRKIAQMKYGLRGVIPDGYIIRVSSIENDTDKSFDLEADFIKSLHDTLPGELGFLTSSPP